MRTFLLTAALGAVVVLVFAVRRTPSPRDLAMSPRGGGSAENDRLRAQMQEPRSEVVPPANRRNAERTSAASSGSDTSTTPDACPSCQEMVEEVAELKKKLARAEARANELSFAALQVAYPEGTPIGDAVRQPEFASLKDGDQRTFVELMERHFPIRITPSEVAWIIDGIKGQGDAQFKSNLVDASIQFLGGRRILDEVARSTDSTPTQKFDKAYVEFVAGLK